MHTLFAEQGTIDRSSVRKSLIKLLSKTGRMTKPTLVVLQSEDEYRAVQEFVSSQCRFELGNSKWNEPTWCRYANAVFMPAPAPLR